LSRFIITANNEWRFACASKIYWFLISSNCDRFLLFCAMQSQTVKMHLFCISCYCSYFA
jgi:hypothetical protein